MAATPENDKDVEIKAQTLADNADERRKRLKQLIVLGKERGYLTYAEINDHLPDDVVDAEQIESIISTFNDMQIQVFDEAPAADEGAPAAMVIAETEKPVRTMTVSMAVMDLDLTGSQTIVFRNAAHGGLSVVYRRPDGNIGWIDPERTKSLNGNGHNGAA